MRTEHRLAAIYWLRSRARLISRCSTPARRAFCRVLAQCAAISPLAVGLSRGAPSLSSHEQCEPLGRPKPCVCCVLESGRKPCKEVEKKSTGNLNAAQMATLVRTPLSTCCPVAPKSTWSGVELYVSNRIVFLLLFSVGQNHSGPASRLGKRHAIGRWRLHGSRCRPLVAGLRWEVATKSLMTFYDQKCNKSAD